MVSNVLKHTTDNLTSPALGYFLTQVHALVSQDYSADITITPNFNTLNPWKLFNNPEDEDIANLVKAGEQATWPKLEWIRNCTKISRTLDSIIEELEKQEVERLGGHNVRRPDTKAKSKSKPRTKKASSK